MTILFEGELLADYHQIYIADTAGDFSADYPTVWTDDIIARGVNVGRGIIVVSTARNMMTPFRVELHGSEPPVDLDATDHAVECGLTTSGEVVIAGCTDYEPDAARARVPPGALRALVVSTGLGRISEDGLDGDDAYVVHLWPASGDAVVVRKQWAGE